MAGCGDSRRRSRRRGRCRGGRRGGRGRGRRRGRARRAGARRRWPRADGRGSSPRFPPARAMRPSAVGGEQRRGDEDHRIVAGARRLDDRGDRRGVADDELMEQLLGMGRRHAATIESGADSCADTALTPAVDSRRVRDLGAGPRRGQTRRPARAGAGRQDRRSCWCASRSRPGVFVRADRLVDDLWAGAVDTPQHAAVEGRQAAPGARRPAGDRQRRRRLPARGRARATVDALRVLRDTVAGVRAARRRRRSRRRRPERVGAGSSTAARCCRRPATGPPRTGRGSTRRACSSSRPSSRRGCGSATPAT